MSIGDFPPAPASRNQSERDLSMIERQGLIGYNSFDPIIANSNSDQLYERVESKDTTSNSDGFVDSIGAFVEYIW